MPPPINCRESNYQVPYYEGAVFHDYHHRSFIFNYASRFTFIDLIFGTYKVPYDPLVALAARRAELAPAEAAAKAPANILPSNPISTMPERSLHRPARQARISGTDMRMVEARISGRIESSIALHHPRKNHAEIGTEGLLKSAHKQDDEALDHHHHIAVDILIGEGKLSAALIEQAEEQSGQHNAKRM